MKSRVRRILFVDDQADVLRALRRDLMAIVDTWDVHFCTDPAEALQSIEHTAPFDLVVADIQPPKMGGIDFLAALQDRFPTTARFAVVPPMSRDGLLQVTSIAHQFLAKPFDAQDLVSRIERACSVKDRLDEAPLVAMLIKSGGVPSVPQTYRAIMDELQAGAPDIGRIAELIERDAGLSAKILQVVNSAFMGLKHHVSSIRQAATLLGLDHLKNLALMAEVFSTQNGMSRKLNLDGLWNHTLRVSLYARRIAQAMRDDAPDDEPLDAAVVQDAATAGLLHEIGHIIFAARMPDHYEKALKDAHEQGITLLAAERKNYSTTHAVIGGYLLDLWGLPWPIVQAVTYFDAPSGLPVNRYDPEDNAQYPAMTALHVAYYFATDSDESDPARRVELDTVYMEQSGLLDCVSKWFDACAAD